MPIITLTTDFGTRDGYVGAVKGVISRIAPEARIVDIAHDIPRGDIAHAAWVVATSTLEFPHGTIHMVVVDPGVGGGRAGVIVRIPAQPPVGEQLYVGPDNGVFGYLNTTSGFRIDKTDALAAQISPTFHGRDVFAYVAAGLALDRDATYFGKRTKLEGKLPWGKRELGKGRIVHIDYYGNLITDLPAEEAVNGIVIEGRRLGLVHTYEDVKSGEILAYIGSAGTVEVAVRDGDAESKFDVERGTVIEAAPRETSPWAPPGPYR